jgi:hypothetical protein
VIIAVAGTVREQYPRMLRIANDRMHICPGPESAPLVGLAQANLVDSNRPRGRDAAAS